MAEHIIQKNFRHIKEQYRELVNDGLYDIGKSAEDWVNFLEFAANNYKQASANIIALYEAFPTGLTFDTYDNFKAMGRQVARGEKGIAVALRDKDGVVKLDFHDNIIYDYVFGLTQTKLVGAVDKILSDRLWHIVSDSDRRTVFEDINAVAEKITKSEILNHVNAEKLKGDYQFILKSVEAMVYFRAGIVPAKWRNDGGKEIATAFENYLLKGVDFTESFSAQQEMIDVVVSAARKSINEIAQKYTKEKGEIVYEDDGRHHLRQPSGSFGKGTERGIGEHSGEQSEYRQVRGNEEPLAGGTEDENRAGRSGIDGAREQGAGVLQRDSGGRSEPDLVSDDGERQSERAERGLLGARPVDERTQSDSGRDSSERDGLREVAGETEQSEIPPAQFVSFYQLLANDTRNVKEWYLSVYPEDALAEEINADVTFSDVWGAVCSGQDVYDVIGAHDSAARERVFAEMGNSHDIDEDVIYDIWVADEADRAELIEDTKEYIRDIVGVTNSGENITFEPDLTPTNHADQNSQGYVFNYEKYYADAFPPNIHNVHIKDKSRVSTELVYGNWVHDEASAEANRNFVIDSDFIKSLSADEQAYLTLEACLHGSNDFSSYQFDKVPNSERLNAFLDIIWQSGQMDSVSAEKADAVARRIFATVLDGKHEASAYNLIKSGFIEHPVVKERYSDYIAELNAHFVDNKVDEIVIDRVVRELCRRTGVGSLIYDRDGNVDTDFFLPANSQKSVAALKDALGLDGAGALGMYPDGYYGSTDYDTFSGKLVIKRGDFDNRNEVTITYPNLIKRLQEIVSPETSLSQIKTKNIRVISHDSGYEQLSLFDFADEGKTENGLQAAVLDNYYVVSGVSMQMFGAGELRMFIRGGENAEVETRLAELPDSAVGKNKTTFDEEFYFDNIDDANRFAELVRKNYNNDEFAKAWTTARRSSIKFGESEKVFEIIGRFIDIEQTATQQPAVQQERANYKIDFEPARFAEKERYADNIAAIKLLKQLETENRLANEEEQDILARYVGWGGLSAVFDDRNSSWSKEYTELKELLTEKEYSAAKQSTATAFYTPNIVTEAIYDALDNFGFKKGNILEPAAGIGKFFGVLPDKMSDSRLFGVEMDEISGRIAKQLYQKADIKIAPYQTVEYPDNFFDVAVSNVPFAQVKPYDPIYNKHKFFVHDYYFAKTLDKVRPGGVIAFVTSTGTMDKTSPEVRKYIAQRADLLGAIRLPDTTFKNVANTSASSDIIFLQKREYIDAAQEPDWVYLEPIIVNGEEFKVNSYFAQHPEMILGTLEKSGMYGGEQTICATIPGTDLEAQLREAIQNIKGEIIRNAEAEFEDIDRESGLFNEIDSIPADPNVRDNSLTIFEDKLYERKGSLMYLRTFPKALEQERAETYAKLTKALVTLIEHESNDALDSLIDASRRELNECYKNFTDKFGLVSDKKNKSMFKDDTNYALASSIEVLNEEGELTGTADILTKRTISPYIVPTRASSSVEALSISLSQKGKVDIDYIANLVAKDNDTVVDELKGIVYRDWQAGIVDDKPVYVTAEEYLSGAVRKKLEWLENSATSIRANGGEVPEDYGDNIRALREVQPKRLEAKEIRASIGATWIPAEYYVQFVRELLDLRPGTWQHDDLVIKQAPKTYKDKLGEKEVMEWSINFAGDRSMYGNELITSVYGVNSVKSAHGFRLIQDCMNCKSTTIVLKDEPKKSAKATLEAQAKQRKIENKFNQWLFKNEKRRNDLVNLYNERFNSTVERKYDGSFLTFPGKNIELPLKDFQKDAVARVIYGGNTLLAHVVGAGKTFEMIASAMESKRLGHCNKPMIVVPNHLVAQTAAEFMRLYPGANIIVPSSADDLSKAKRRKFVARIATNNCDAVIIPHSFFNKMVMSVEYCRQFTDKEKARLEAAKKEKGGRSGSVKNIEVALSNLEERVKKMDEAIKRDINIEFDKLGCDMLFIDEAHEYKNRAIYTNIQAKGLGSVQGSNRAYDMDMKVQYINKLTNYKGVVFATGTPVSNSLAELYTMQNYLRPDRLKDYGIETFDTWAKTFATVESVAELDVTGVGFRTVDRLSRFFNIPELMNIVREFADIKTSDMLKLETPEAEYQKVIVEPTATQTAMIEELKELCEYVRAYPKNEDVKRMGGMLGVTNKGRKVALDQRYVNPDAPDEKGTKLDTVAENVARIYKETEKDRLTQVIFCDLATPKPKKGGKSTESLIFEGDFCAYDDIKKKLIERGVKEDEIAYIHDAEAKSDPTKAKQEIFNKMQAGKIRVLLGSTQKLGTGANIQKKLIALHNVDCPWRPSDFAQRIGRIVRQGNENEKVYIYNYGVKKTFDSYMYGVVAAKQKFAGQIMTGQIKDRECDDLGEEKLNCSQMMACLTDDPRIMDQINLTQKVKRLEEDRAYFYQDKYEAEDKLSKVFPKQLALHENRIKEYTKIAQVAKEATATNYAELQAKTKALADEIANAKDSLSDAEIKELREKRAELKKLENSTFGGMYYEKMGVLSTDRANANKILFEAINNLDKNCFSEDVEPVYMGKYRNIDLHIYYHFSLGQPVAALSVDGGTPLEIPIAASENADNFQRIDNSLGSLESSIRIEESDLQKVKDNIERCKDIVKLEYDQQDELDKLQEELIRLNQELDVSKNKSFAEEEQTADYDLSEARTARTHGAVYNGKILDVLEDKVVQQWEDNGIVHDIMLHEKDNLIDADNILERGANVCITYRYNGSGVVTELEKEKDKEIERD